MTPRDRLDFLYAEEKRLENERVAVGKRLFEIDRELIAVYDEITQIHKMNGFE